MNKFSPLAVIDIGSNSIRLVIFDCKKKFAIPIFNEKTQCGLGSDLRISKMLPNEACLRANKVIERYISISRSINCELVIVGTAAIREALNGKEFVHKINQNFNVSILILSSKEEARFSYLGVLSSFNDPKGFIGDLGGGSLELVSSKDIKFENTITLPLGTLQFRDIYKKKEELTELIDKYLDQSSWLKNEKNKSFYAIGGAWRSLAKVFMSWSNYPISVIHHYEISLSRAVDICRVLSNLNYSLKSMSVISKSRRKSVPYSALLLERILLKIEPQNIIFSSYGLREGILFDRLDENDKKEDSLVSYCRKISKNESRFYENIKNYFKWLHPIIKKFPDNELRLAEAACYLSDIAWKIHPEYRAEFALKKVIYAPFVEVNHSERLYIAKVLFKRYKGDLEKNKEYNEYNILSASRLERAIIIGVALDFAYTITGSSSGNIFDCEMSFNKNNLLISLKNNLKINYNRACDKKIKILSNLLKCEYKVINL